MRIKITGCKNPKFWYSDKIGQILEVTKSKYGYDYLIPNDNGTVTNGMIHQNDAIEITEDET